MKRKKRAKQHDECYTPGCQKWKGVCWVKVTYLVVSNTAKDETINTLWARLCPACRVNVLSAIKGVMP